MYHTQAYPEYLKPCLLLFYSNASENIIVFFFDPALKPFLRVQKPLVFFFWFFGLFWFFGGGGGGVLFCFLN